MPDDSRRSRTPGLPARTRDEAALGGPMKPKTVRTSTILISVGERTEVYRSLDQVPKSLRRRIEETTAGQNSGTILIADRRGRQEILEALNRRGNVATGRAPAKPRPLDPAVAFLRRWGLVLLPCAAGCLAWLAAAAR